jgi:hypothetical protein
MSAAVLVPTLFRGRVSLRPADPVRGIVTKSSAKVPNASLTRHHFTDIVLSEGGGTTPHPIWVGDQKAKGLGDVS